jgi:hypothetical protein
MPKSSRLNELLDKGEIKRGKGFTLSTEEHSAESALVHKSTSAPVHSPSETIRPSKGFKLRSDVADACKLVAAQEKRKLYEVMEEALIEYLQKHDVNIH